ITARTGLPVTHLDAVFWRPGWIEPDKEEFNERVRRIIAQERWIIEGGYSRTYPERATQADLILFLDVSTPVRVLRVLRRLIQYHGRSRPDLTEGCPEKLNLSFMHWVATWRWHSRPKSLRLINDPAFSSKSVRLRSGQIPGFLDRRFSRTQ
ncbi:MAG: hypothetical protein AAGA69_08225, partial [Pseudomonadota bacterium]